MKLKEAIEVLKDHIKDLDVYYTVCGSKVYTKEVKAINTIINHHKPKAERIDKKKGLYTFCNKE